MAATGSPRSSSAKFRVSASILILSGACVRRLPSFEHFSLALDDRPIKLLDTLSVDNGEG